MANRLVHKINRSSACDSLNSLQVQLKAVLAGKLLPLVTLFGSWQSQIFRSSSIPSEQALLWIRSRAGGSTQLIECGGLNPTHAFELRSSGSGALRKRGKSSGPCGPRRSRVKKSLRFHFIAADAKLFAVQGVVRQQFPALISSGHDGELRDFSALSAPLLLANLWRKRHFPRKSLR